MRDKNRIKPFHVKGIKGFSVHRDSFEVLLFQPVPLLLFFSDPLQDH